MMKWYALTTTLVLILPVPVSAADCEPILEAFQALAARDTYAQTVTMDGSVVEMRVLPDAMYVNADGQWNSMRGGPEIRQQMLAQIVPDASALMARKRWTLAVDLPPGASAQLALDGVAGRLLESMLLSEGPIQRRGLGLDAGDYTLTMVPLIPPDQLSATARDAYNCVTAI